MGIGAVESIDPGFDDFFRRHFAFTADDGLPL
jgi:hypothetical protein